LKNLRKNNLTRNINFVFYLYIGKEKNMSKYSKKKRQPPNMKKMKESKQMKREQNKQEREARKERRILAKKSQVSYNSK